ncbi:BTB/POZ domain-containing protein KCTD21 [Stylophora pistillata]|uniref:BTB/POZ domain-containing protein KCTD21 n=1 Tax=Stylophora pistillata TaxID=50429 RepID=A0A2B4SNK9_STYPI|nr:BTB/POZ domain-containing protein KCTD21 [Stylophora pistillata]
MSLSQLAHVKLSGAEKLMADAREHAMGKTADAQRLMAEASILLKQDLENAARENAVIDKITKTLSEVHFANKIKLNVGGKIYKTTLDTLRRDPDSLLCAMFSGKFKLRMDEEDGAYFIDRDAELFRYVLNYLRDGNLFCPNDNKVQRELLAEARFYQIQGIITDLEEKIPFESTLILKNEAHHSILLSWLPPGANCSLLYQASFDGQTPADFHRCCDDRGPTIVVIRVGPYVFEGFSSQSWESALINEQNNENTQGIIRGVIDHGANSGIRKFKKDKSSYLFTLVNQTASDPFKLNAVAGGGIGCKKKIGPNFGTAQLIGLAVWPSNSRLCSQWGNGFSEKSRRFFGSESFEIDELEVFQIPKECSTTFYKHDKLDFHLYILNYLRDGDLLYPEDQTAKEQLLKEAKFYQVQGIINHLEEALSFGIPSSIIKDKNHESYLLSWLSPGTTISLMYRASVDGETPADFHRCCDEKGPTLVVIKSGEYICGGYTSKSWTSASPIKAIEDSYSFLFTLENPSGSEPVKINPKADAHGGIRCDSRKGPSFGTSQFYDLEVWRTFNATRPEEILSYFDLGYGFICPESVDNIPYFTGKNPFKIEELEVFKRRIVSVVQVRVPILPQQKRYILNYLRDGDLLYPDDQTAKEQLLKEAKFYQVQGIISYLEEALSPIHSSIIKDKNHVSTLLSWMSPGTTFSLLYCASVNGKNPGIFHRCCDKKGPTLLVIKSGEYIFGGYASKSWRSALSVRGIEDSKSFLFTLEGPSGSEPIRINPTPGAHGGIRSENQQEKSMNNPCDSHVYGQIILTFVSQDRVGLMKWATLWKLKELQLLSEIKEMASSTQRSLIKCQWKWSRNAQAVVKKFHSEGRCKYDLHCQLSAMSLQAAIQERDSEEEPSKPTSHHAINYKIKKLQDLKENSEKLKSSIQKENAQWFTKKSGKIISGQELIGLNSLKKRDGCWLKLLLSKGQFTVDANETIKAKVSQVVLCAIDDSDDDDDDNENEEEDNNSSEGDGSGEDDY